MYLTMIQQHKNALIIALHNMRNLLKKQAIKVRATKARITKPRKKKDITSMLSPEQLALFMKHKI